MQLGFVSAILNGWSFEETLDVANMYGYECVEVACWPFGKGERRYAGVSHIDVTNLDKDSVNGILRLCTEKGVAISALGYYPNVLDADQDKATDAKLHLENVIKAAAALDVGIVTTFVGRDQTKTVEENLELFEKIWPAIVRFADGLGVKIAIENCPMLFDAGQWPGGQNLATTPEIWRKMFEILPDKNFGLNFDPSHFVWQMMDYTAPLYEFADRIFHVHFKDIKIFKDLLKKAGTMAYPLDYMAPKLPGLGDVDWRKFVSALTDIGYSGPACVEVEDKAFEHGKAGILESLRLSAGFLSGFVPH